MSCPASRRLPYPYPFLFDKVKATDETLTSENWETILNLCDKVQDEGEQGSVFRHWSPIMLILTFVR
jgi:hypothetical protein